MPAPEGGLGPRRVLVIQLGDIGDLVWSVPTFQSVKAAWPQAHLAVLVPYGLGDLVRTEPCVDEVFEIPSPAGLWRSVKENLSLIGRLRAGGYDLAVDLRTGDRGGVMARLSGARLRVGLRCDDASTLRDLMFNLLLTPVEEGVRKVYGAAEQSLRVVRPLGVEAVTTVPRLGVDAGALERVGRLLEEAGLEAQKGSFFTINPFSRWSYKEWVLKRWADLCRCLNETFGLPVLIVGSPAERGRAEGIVGHCPGVATSFAGKTSLAELAALLHLSRLHVGVDSAPPHIAAAVGTPTVTLYGPTDWKDWAPVGEDHRVVTARAMACVPCYRKGCREEGVNPCLEAITAADVMEAVRELVSPPR